MPTYRGLLTGQLDPDDAISSGAIRIEDYPGSLKRFLEVCGLHAARLMFC
jgi:hypothetical protein